MLNQLQTIWRKLKPRQRAALGAGTFMFLALLVAFVRIFSAPEYKLLANGLDPGDVQAISAQLAIRKIPFQPTADGKGITVAADQLDAARIEVATSGVQHSGRMGFELFDKSSWGQTEFDEKVNYQRALEGELERTIQTLEGVRTARVHLVMPSPSVFLDRDRAAKASVTLKMKHGALSPEQLTAVSRLVAGAVDDLSPRDVTIIDADSNEPLGAHGATLEGRELEAELSRRLVQTLGPAVGPENLRASVNVEYDLRSTEENQDRYDPAISAVLSSQKSQEQSGAGTTPGGIAGASANLPNPSGVPSAASTDQNQETSSTENSTFGVNKTVSHTVSPAGRIHRITAAVLVNDVLEHKLVKGRWTTVAQKRSPAQLAQLTELAKGVLGADKERGDTITVENMPFTDIDLASSEPGFLERARALANDFSTPLRYGALLALFILMWALLFRPIQKQFAGSLKELSSVGGGPALPGPDGSKPELHKGETLAGMDEHPEAVSLKRELTELVQKEPAMMTRTLQAWLREDAK